MFITKWWRNFLDYLDEAEDECNGGTGRDFWPPPKEVPMEDVTFADLDKLDMRFGLVRSAERIPKSNKLIKMQVSFGEFERQIVAGVGLSYDVEALVDRMFLFITNLAPIKLMGVESHGMLFATGNSTTLHLVVPTDSAAGDRPEPGARIG